MNLHELRKSLPEEIARAADGYAWRRNRVGMSETIVIHLTARAKAPLYLKIAPPDFKSALSEEKQRLDWLKNRLPVPEVLAYAEDEARAYLLLTEVPGVPGSDDSVRRDVPGALRQMVGGLKIIHALPAANCPFRILLAEKIEAARERVRRGLVDEEDFDEERLGRSAAEVFREMLETAPPVEDPVFAHGDYCAPNVILNNGKLRGFIDWAGAGIADRYQDLALLSRSVRDNFGAEYESAVFDLYGITPDRAKIRFYRLLDEFF